ncbi:hypothetical protein AGMMS49992_07230 [Clostridia bacterium]|nr:hypothetical protein AGMMS49992_07230 [Clostridia bacterium]
MRPEYSKWLHRFRAALVLTLALALSGLLGAALAIPSWVSSAQANGDIDPVTARIEIQPATLSGQVSVHVSIQISNVGDDDIPGALVLFDPANNRVTSFGSGGSLTLNRGQQYPWQGDWYVTQDQLNAGQITYTLQYPRMISGQVQTVTKNITARFTYSKPINHKINVQRSYSPANPEEGETVTIDYRIENTGGVNLKNLYIEDRGVGVKKDDLLVDSLAVGAQVTKSFSFKMGAATVSSQPTIYYTPEGQEKAVSGTVEKIISIVPTKIDIIATLTVNKEIINRGDSVTLTCEVKNSGSMAYSNITISDASLGVVAQNINLGSKKTYKETKTIKVSAPGTYKFEITGSDANGNPLSLSSNEITVQTREDAKPISLSISIESDRDVIYTDPATAIFVVTVKNTGEETVKDIVVSEYGKDVYTIPQLKPGEQDVRAKEFTLLMGGTFMFKATAKDTLGTSKSFESNTSAIVYQAPRPTPSPTPTMSPTPAPTPTQTPTATVSLTNTPGSNDFGRILLWVLAGLLVLILGGVGAMFMLDRRKAPSARPTGGGSRVTGSGAIEVIDRLDRTPRRDYTRAAKNAAKGAGLPVLAKAFAKKRTGTDDLPEDDDSEFTPSRDNPYAPVSTGMIYDDFDGMDEVIEPEIPSLNSGRYDAERYLEPEDTHRIDPKDIVRASERYAPPLKIVPEPVSQAKSSPELEPEPDSEAGSSGQYRLTRRAGTLRPKAEPPISLGSEDPTSFAKKQRARRGREINTAQFYEEEE